MRVEIEIAESGHLRPLAATCGHLRPLAATCGHSLGAATCGHSLLCVFPFVSPFPCYALLPSASFKSYIPLVSSSLSFQLFPAVCSVLPSDLILPVSSQLFLSVRCVLSFISSLPFHLLLPFFRINSYVLFVSLFLPFQLFLSIRCVCAFVFLSFQFSSSICYFLSFA